MGLKRLRLAGANNQGAEATRGCDQDANQKIEQLGNCFDELKSQIQGFDTEAQQELRQQLSDVTTSFDLGALLCNPDTEKEDFLEKLEELQTEEKNDLCQRLEQCESVPWRF